MLKIKNVPLVLTKMIPGILIAASLVSFPIFPSQKFDSSVSGHTYTVNNEMNISGTYNVDGTNPNGSKYRGKVEIQKNGNQYAFHWTIGTQSYDGTGTLNGTTLTVQWGDTYPVVYQVMDNGRKLVGIWANGNASEILTH